MWAVCRCSDVPKQASSPGGEGNHHSRTVGWAAQAVLWEIDGREYLLPFQSVQFVPHELNSMKRAKLSDSVQGCLDAVKNIPYIDDSNISLFVSKKPAFMTWVKLALNARLTGTMTCIAPPNALVNDAGDFDCNNYD
jgi:hypothetical protein